MALRKDGKKKSENTGKDIPEEIAAAYVTPDEPETGTQCKN